MIEIYTKPGCGYCQKAKQLLSQLGHSYKEHTLGVTITKESVQKKVDDLGIKTAIRTVPQIFYTNKAGKTIYIGGYIELTQKTNILGT